MSETFVSIAGLIGCILCFDTQNEGESEANGSSASCCWNWTVRAFFLCFFFVDIASHVLDYIFVYNLATTSLWAIPLGVTTSIAILCDLLGGRNSQQQRVIDLEHKNRAKEAQAVLARDRQEVARLDGRQIHLRNVVRTMEEETRALPQGEEGDFVARLKLNLAKELLADAEKFYERAVARTRRGEYIVQRMTNPGMVPDDYVETGPSAPFGATAITHTQRAGEHARVAHTRLSRVTNVLLFELMVFFLEDVTTITVYATIEGAYDPNKRSDVLNIWISAISGLLVAIGFTFGTFRLYDDSAIFALTAREKVLRLVFGVLCLVPTCYSSFVAVFFVFFQRNIDEYEYGKGYWKPALYGSLAVAWLIGWFFVLQIFILWCRIWVLKLRQASWREVLTAIVN